MSFPKPLFSLTRFQQENPELPCWVAGRFFKIDSQSYFLKSQGVTLFCKSPAQKHEDGSWVAAQLLSEIPTQTTPSAESAAPVVTPTPTAAPNYTAIPKPPITPTVAPDHTAIPNPPITPTSTADPNHTAIPNPAVTPNPAVIPAKAGISRSSYPSAPNSKSPLEELSFKKKPLACYKTGEPLILKSPEAPYKEKPFSYQKKGAVLQSWHSFLKAVEDFFISKGLAFAETPHLVKCPGTEPSLRALKSSFKNYYLPTSPELQLKKLLCQDWTDFFEIKTCFREEDSNELHQVEFHLLEWYRAFYSLEELMREVYDLLLFLQQSYFKFRDSYSKTASKNSSSLEKKPQKAPSLALDPAYKIPPAEFLTVSNLFERHLQFALTPKTSQKELFQLARKNSLPVRESFSFEDLFFSLFLNKIEPHISQETPLFIHSYPPQLRAFAQINSEGWADRFELYWKGMELANAFYEVTQFEEQKQLFQDHLREREDETPLDEELLQVMKEGMPPACGAALGLDRLFLALTGAKSLKSTRLFPL